MLRYLRAMGGCIGMYRPNNRGSDSSEDGSFTTHNRPLKHRKPKWKSNIRLTESQLNAKREEFWDTAPAFEGRKEIWDALRASVNALEVGDYQMAQVILDGANISLPNGTLMDCYDELGSHYQLPVYVLSAPVNLISKDEERYEDSTQSKNEESSPVNVISKRHQPKKEREEVGREIPIKIRFTNGDDYRLMVNSTDQVASVKCSLVRCLPGVDPATLRFFFAGRQLANKSTLASAKIDSNYTIQATISEVAPTIVQPEKEHKHHGKQRNKHSNKPSKSGAKQSHLTADIQVETCERSANGRDTGRVPEAYAQVNANPTHSSEQYSNFTTSFSKFKSEKGNFKRFGQAMSNSNQASPNLCTDVLRASERSVVFELPA